MSSTRKALREAFDSIEIWSIISTVAVLLVGLFIFVYFNDIRDTFRTWEKDKLKGNAIAEIVAIESIERITQSKWKGTQIYIDSYKISYRYIVNGKPFQSTDILTVTTENQKLLKSLLNRKPTDKFQIKYDLANPEKSFLE